MYLLRTVLWRASNFDLSDTRPRIKTHDVDMEHAVIQPRPGDFESVSQQKATLKLSGRDAAMEKTLVSVLTMVSGNC